MRKSRRACRNDRVDIRRLHPLVLHDFMIDPVLPRDLRDPLAIHAVFDNQQAAAFRHQPRDHAFDRRRSRTGHQHGGPHLGIERIGRQQARARFVLQIEKFRLAMTQVGLQQALAHAFSQRDRSGIQQQHDG